MDAIMQAVAADQLKKKGEIPDFDSGDTVRVHVRVVEGEKERVQVFEGVVIQRRGGGIHESFTVRKIAVRGVGVERIFPLHSPRLAQIELIRRGKVRRSRIKYLRGLRGRAARIAEAMDVARGAEAVKKKVEEAAEEVAEEEEAG